MSVLVTLRVRGEVEKLERLAAGDPGLFRGVRDRAVERGVISHCFWTNGDEVLVVDEWPDEESFAGFFDTTPEIQQIMQLAGTTAAPEITFWRRAQTRDEIAR